MSNSNVAKKRNLTTAFGPANAAQTRANNSSRADDCYFTRQQVANERIIALKQCITFGTNANWIEPSVGAGAFISAIFKTIETQNVRKVFAIDIKEYSFEKNEKVEFIKQDFTTFLPPSSSSTNSIVTATNGSAPVFIVVGNPPFGKNSSLAVQFFNHAASFCNVIAFIVPRTFEKPQIINRLDRNFHLVQQEQLGENCFEFEGQIVSVPCLWCVWVKNNFLPRHPSWSFAVGSKRPLLSVGAKESLLVSFLPSNVGATMMVQRVGCAAGRVTRNRAAMREKAKSRNFYFVKIDDKLLDDVRKNRLETFDMENCEEKNRCAGMPSISKPELVKALHEWLSIDLE